MSLDYTGAQNPADIIASAGMLCGQYNTMLSSGKADKFTSTAEAMFGSLIEAELGSNRWRFAQHTQEIASYADVDPSFNGWKYQWSLPADCLMLISIDPLMDYLVYGKYILTRQLPNNELKAKYCRNVPVNFWNAAFKHYFTYALAEILAESATNASKAEKIGKLKSYWESRALFADGQSSFGTVMAVKPWIAVRYAGGQGGNYR